MTENLGFWVAVAAMTGGVALVLWRSISAAAARGGSADGTRTANLAVYRDQMAEVDRDLLRGTLAAAEADQARAEIGRRMIEADRRPAMASVTGGRPVPVWAGLLIAALIALVPVAYRQLGAPGYPDLPLAERLLMSDQAMANRPAQAAAVATVPEAAATPADPAFMSLMTRLREAVADRPDDLQGLGLLARNELALGNFKAAEAAQRQILSVKGEAATAGDHAFLAEVLIRAAGGYVSPEAEAVLIAALKRDASLPPARYFTGLMFAQGGRFDRAFAIWQPLLDESPPDAPWVGPIRLQLPEVAARAGIRYALPEITGPSGEDIEAASNLPEADRDAMIEGMVAQLSERLASEGGPTEDWARLIRSLGVLQRLPEAQAIYDEAKGVFAGQTADLSFLRQTAVEAGLAP